MKLDEFIIGVLCDIDRGLKEATKETKRKYHVRTGNYGNVNFDIAVTTATSSGNEIEGRAKTGYITVIGAELGTKIESKQESSQISRIQFNVYFPELTEEESKLYFEKMKTRKEN